LSFRNNFEVDDRRATATAMTSKPYTVKRVPMGMNSRLNILRMTRAKESCPKALRIYAPSKVLCCAG
jgi:hypothetical protein